MVGFNNFQNMFTSEPLPAPSPVIFEPTKEAAAHNSKLLANYQFNYKNAVKSNKKSIIIHGSEFHTVKSISKLWQYRHDWTKIKNNVFKGIKYPLKPDLPDNQRLLDLQKMIERGNHPSANDPGKADFLRKNYDNETFENFMIPILPDIFKK